MLSDNPFFKAWMKLFLLIFTVASALLLPVLLKLDKDRENLTAARQQNHLSSASQSIDAMFTERSGDIRVLATSPSIKRFVDDLGENEQSVISMFEAFCLAYLVYDQVRLLNLEGTEIVRVNNANGRCKAVPVEELQNKSDSYYFKEAFKTRNGEVYVSPLDLNVEGGKLEEPYKPMIRFAVPVIGPQGGIRGVLVTNFLAEQFLKTLFPHQNEGNLVVEHRDFLVNEQGYYLRNEDAPDREFGFMVGNQDKSIIRDYPSVWQALQQGKSSIKTDHGLFLIQSVPVPVSGLTKKPEVGLISSSKHWFLFHLITAEGLSKISILRGPYRWVWLTQYLLVIGLVSFLWTERRMQLAARRDVEKRYERLYQENDLILSSSGNGIYGVDIDDKATFFNPAAEKMLGWERGELIGKPTHEMIHHSHSDGSHYAIEESPLYFTMRDGQPRDIEQELFWRKDGTSFPVSYVVNPMIVNGEIKGGVVVFQDISEQVAQKKRLEKMMKELERLSVTDDLTKLFNRRKLDETLEREVIRAQRFKNNLAVIMLDIDHFKEVNDQHGHQVGDQVLSHLAKILHAHVRETDTLGRWGGEEFFIISPGNDLTGVTFFAEKIRRIIADYDFPVVGTTTCSIGVANWMPEEWTDSLVARVDAALYRAKAEGRNSVVVAES